ncbi:Mas-related G-protein coupled receptor member H [Plecturocebus cupreus]
MEIIMESARVVKRWKDRTEGRGPNAAGASLVSHPPSHASVWRRVLHTAVLIASCRANDTRKLHLPFLTTGLQEKTSDSPRMKLLAATVNPLESALCTGNESLNQTTWSSEPATQPPEESQEQDSYIYVPLVICMLGVTGNGLLMLCLILYLKRKPFTVYIHTLPLLTSWEIDEMSQKSFKNVILGQAWWFTLVIPALWEAKAGLDFKTNLTNMEKLCLY